MFAGKQIAALKLEGAVGAAINLSGTLGYILIPFRCKPIRIGTRITTIISSTGNLTLTFTKTATGDVGTLTIPNTAAATKTYYEERTSDWETVLNEGDRLTVAVSGTYSSGAGVPYLLVEVDPERPANNSNMVSG